jgi:hypothetical protein
VAATTELVEGYGSFFAGLGVGMGLMVYRSCVAVKEWGERMKLDPVVSLGRLAMKIVSCFVRVGGRRSRRMKSFTGRGRRPAPGRH